MTEQTFYSILPQAFGAENLQNSGLVNDCISPRSKPPRPISNITFLKGGAIVKRHNLSPNVPPLAGGRGSIRGFSAAARRRMLHNLMGVDWDLLMPPPTPGRVYGAFVTLTYPDQFSEDWEVWKRDLDTIQKRVERFHPGMAEIWKEEMKKRKSGENEGKLAPHFHFLAYFPNGLNLAEFRIWLSQAWFEVVGSTDIKHLAAGTRVDALYGTVAKLMNYCAKYLGKDFETDKATGRCWGERGSMPRCEIYSYDVDHIEFLRRVRRWGKASPYLKSRKWINGMMIFNPAVAFLTVGLRVDGIPPPDKLYRAMVYRKELEKFERLAQIAEAREFFSPTTDELPEHFSQAVIGWWM